MADILATLESGGTLNGSHVPQLVAGSTVLIVLPSIAVFLRLLSRWMARAPLWWDDYAVILALVFSWAPNIINLAEIHNGFGKHLMTLPPDAIFQYFKGLFAFELVYTFALALVKYSIILFLYRIFPIIHFRRVLMGWAAIVTALLIAALLIDVFECVPVADFWRMMGGYLGGHCIKVKVYFIAIGSISAVINFVLLSMPIPLLWKLRTRTLQKVLLTCIFTVGLVVCVVSVVRLIVLSNSNDPDLTWSYTHVSIWSAAEPSIGVVSACLPSLRPLFARTIWGRSYRPKKVYDSTDSSNARLSYSWNRNTPVQEQSSGNFNRLRDDMAGDAEQQTWTNKWSAYGGKNARKHEEDIGMGEVGDRRSVVPEKGIRVRTTVTVTEKVDWQDNLF